MVGGAPGYGFHAPGSDDPACILIIEKLGIKSFARTPGVSGLILM